MGRIAFFLATVAGMGFIYCGDSAGKDLSRGLRPVVTVKTPYGVAAQVYLSLRPAKEYCILYYRSPSVVDVTMPIRRLPEGADFRMPLRDLRMLGGPSGEREKRK